MENPNDASIDSTELFTLYKNRLEVAANTVAQVPQHGDRNIQFQYFTLAINRKIDELTRIIAENNSLSLDELLQRIHAAANANGGAQVCRHGDRNIQFQYFTLAINRKIDELTRIIAENNSLSLDQLLQQIHAAANANGGAQVRQYGGDRNVQFQYFALAINRKIDELTILTAELNAVKQVANNQQSNILSNFYKLKSNHTLFHHSEYLLPPVREPEDKIVYFHPQRHCCSII